MAVNTNLPQFRRALVAEFQAFQAQEVRIVKQVALETLRDVINRSPVATGYYRASHGLTIGQPLRKPRLRPPGRRQIGTRRRRRAQAESDFDSGVGLGPGVAEAEAQQTLNSIRTLPRRLSIYISNPLPYASRIEDGHSMQAPGGVYTIAAIRAENLLREAVLENRRRR